MPYRATLGPAAGTTCSKLLAPPMLAAAAAAASSLQVITGQPVTSRRSAGYQHKT